MGAYVEKRMADTIEKYLRESRRTFPPIPPPLPHTNYFSVADKMGSTYNEGLPNIPTEFTQHAWPVTRKFKKEPLSCWRSSSMSRHQGVPGLQDPPTGGGRPPGGVGQWWCSCHRHTGAKRVLRHDGTHKAADRSRSDKRQPPNAALRLLKNVQPSPSPCAGS